jgi:hypothetical protein
MEKADISTLEKPDISILVLQGLLYRRNVIGRWQKGGLFSLLSFCAIGKYLLFSLDDTPNLRARLAEMGLDASHFQPMPRFIRVEKKTGG